jgi:hypothetical protein
MPCFIIGFYSSYLTKITIIALTVAIGFTFTACGEGAGSGGGGGGVTPVVPTSATYTGGVYTLVITQANRAAYSPIIGDTYVLTINTGGKSTVL